MKDILSYLSTPATTSEEVIKKSTTHKISIILILTIIGLLALILEQLGIEVLVGKATFESIPLMSLYILAGLISLIVILWISGKILGGKGKLTDVATITLLSLTPLILVTIISAVGHLMNSIAIISLTGFIGLFAFIYSFGILITGISKVEKIGGGKAFSVLAITITVLYLIISSILGIFNKNIQEIHNKGLQGNIFSRGIEK